MSKLSQAIFLLHLVDNRLSGSGAFSESSLTISDWCALRVLMERRDDNMKTNVSKLADLLGVSRQRGKQVIDNLVLGGYVSTAESDGNAHIRFATVTGKGERAAAAIDDSLDAKFEEVFGGKGLRAGGLVKQLRKIDAAGRRLEPRATRADRKNKASSTEGAGELPARRLQDEERRPDARGARRQGAAGA
jgi:DNA-binding MarR family transcriptional regulator